MSKSSRRLRSASQALPRPNGRTRNVSGRCIAIDPIDRVGPAQQRIERPGKPASDVEELARLAAARTTRFGALTVSRMASPMIGSTARTSLSNSRELPSSRSPGRSPALVLCPCATLRAACADSPASVSGPCATVLRKRLDRVDRVRVRHRLDDRARRVDRRDAGDAALDRRPPNLEAVEDLLVGRSRRVDDAVDRAARGSRRARPGVPRPIRLVDHLDRHAVALDQRGGAFGGVELVPHAHELPDHLERLGLVLVGERDQDRALRAAAPARPQPAPCRRPARTCGRCPSPRRSTSSPVRDGRRRRAASPSRRPAP